MIQTWNINYKGTLYAYSIKNIGDFYWTESANFECEKIGINEIFALEDIPNLIKDLPNIIEKLNNDTKKHSLTVRLSALEKVKIKTEALKNNMSISDFIKNKCLI